MYFKFSNTGPALALAALLGTACAADARAGSSVPGEHAVSATYYAKVYNGRRTASGERYDPAALTAAHPTLPLGSVVEVVRPANGKRVVVRINDRNGGQPGIDLSRAAARELNLLAAGRDTVIVRPLEQLAKR
jgi:rare lipoprotein A